MSWSLAWLALLGATAGATPELRPGRFLYADPTLVGSVFEASVIVLVQVEKGGTTGLILNKPTRLQPGPLLGLEAAARLTRPLYLGGPVATQGASALVRPAGEPPADALRVLGDVFFTADLEGLGPTLSQPQPDRRVRVYLGHAGWAAGQLEAEIARGSWVVARGRVEAIFAEEPATLWKEVYRLLNRIEARIRPQPVRPSRARK